MLKLTTIRPNSSIASKYRVILSKLINMMIKDINNIVHKSYKTNIVQDSQPIDNLRIMLDALNIKWTHIFTNNASRIVTNTINDVDKHNRSVLVSSLLKLDTEFDLSLLSSKNIVDAKQALIQENIDLIKSIPIQHMQKVSNAVFSSISRDKGITYLADQLQEISGITKRRAHIIARDQINKATSVINNTRCDMVGIIDAIWRHNSISKKPRASHLKADGTRYKISKGCFIDNEYIQTGQKINCNCYNELILL